MNTDPDTNLDTDPDPKDHKNQDPDLNKVGSDPNTLYNHAVEVVGSTGTVLLEHRWKSDEGLTQTELIRS